MSRHIDLYKRITFIGGGNIASAVACGLVKAKTVHADSITVFDINDKQLNKFSAYGINTTTDLREAIIDANLIFIAVKPAVVSDVIKQISALDCLSDDFVIASFAAAVSISHIENAFGREVAVIRTMPSTPILIGEGVLAVSKNKNVDSKHFESFCRIMSTIAFVSPIDESLMNPIIAVHGSSPAYVYLFIKSMLDSSAKLGIEPSVALPLILKTIKGSVSMVEQCDISIDQLISNVASPNGTTLAALNSFYNDDFQGAVERAMIACTNRANEISEEL